MTTPRPSAAPRSGGIAPAIWAWLAVYLVFFGLFGLYIGGDGTPDLRIYHRYNGFALVSGGRPDDIAAAGLQSYFFPGLDGLYFLLTQTLNDHPAALHVIMALPYAVAALLVYLVGRRVLPQSWPLRDVLAGAAALFGVTGSASFSTIGTTMSEIPQGLPFLAGLAVWLGCVPLRDRPGLPVWTVALAGLLAGATVGLKLTSLPLFVGLFVAVIVAELPRWRTGIAAGFVFGLAGVIAAFAVAGWWWWHVYQLTGNPVFPAFNDVFRSDWVAAGRWSDDRFKPQTWQHALLFPALWAFTYSNQAIELAMRDARLLLALAAMLALLVSVAFGGLRRAGPPSRRAAGLLALALFIAYGLWEAMFAIYRYSALIECFSGVLVCAAVAAWLPRRMMACIGIAAVVVIGIATVWHTHYPWWDRSRPNVHAVEINLPPVEPGALVVFLDPGAFSYLIPDLPTGVQVIAPNSNLVNPDAEGTLRPRMEAAIRAFDGPIWGFENLKDYPGAADSALQHYGLKRTGECAPITSTIDAVPAQGCRLEKVPPTP